jgi:hypothetical protein
MLGGRVNKVENKTKNRKYHTFNRKIIETEGKLVPLAHIYMTTHFPVPLAHIYMTTHFPLPLAHIYMTTHFPVPLAHIYMTTPSTHIYMTTHFPVPLAHIYDYSLSCTSSTHI